MLILALMMAPLVPAMVPAPAFAVQPDEVLADPVLEARARDLSKVLRCPVCQSENIDESNAEVSRDLRILVRERLVAGDSDSAVLDYVTARYGEYVLFQPDASGGNLILWLAGPVMLLAGLGIGFSFLRGRRPGVEPPVEALDAAEQRRLDEILDK
ncbi:cytochrome C biogenesis protein CcdA [Frigidibacter albus]|uniref:Cytochrome c-type biogenesis protein n=2 Tax=Frigidibacter albus TaxID=1465486 RepID=A0A6L8VEC5_9RHOB|nr:cytochrome c-type biogenesis protein [Frigidibacter albus]MZQ88101.1 cytochrome C biogenesis protein CcdA [Frigidibacter albus]NBE30225.1 cytochrome C biogenesis protein CcdA [Frigidibacter albus]GGH47475.1 cytochrome c biogenesis protein CcdA [Frigidibacter albus]